MNSLTYQQQWDKLTEAYIKGEVEPNMDCACFVGNLLNGNALWAVGRKCNYVAYDKVDPVINGSGVIHMLNVLKKESDAFYKPRDIVLLEEMFLNTYYGAGGLMDDFEEDIKEDALFTAFEKTLELLKQIHIEKGEKIDEVKPFIKRKLKSHETANMEH